MANKAKSSFAKYLSTNQPVADEDNTVTASKSSLHEAFHKFVTITVDEGETPRFVTFSHPEDPEAPVQIIDGDGSLHFARGALNAMAGMRTNRWHAFGKAFHSRLSLAECKGAQFETNVAFALPDWDGEWEQDGMSISLPTPPEGFVGMYSIQRGNFTMRKFPIAEMENRAWNDQIRCSYSKQVAVGIYLDGYTLKVQLGPRTRALLASHQEVWDTQDDAAAIKMSNEKLFASIQNQQMFQAAANKVTAGVYGSGVDLSTIELKVHGEDRFVAVADIPDGVTLYRYYRGSDTILGSKNGLKFNKANKFVGADAIEWSRRGVEIAWQ